jgi:hypothetical protein
MQFATTVRHFAASATVIMSACEWTMAPVGTGCRARRLLSALVLDPRNRCRNVISLNIKGDITARNALSSNASGGDLCPKTVWLRLTTDVQCPVRNSIR